MKCFFSPDVPEREVRRQSVPGSSVVNTSTARVTVNTYTHTPFFPAVLLPVVSMATEAQLLSAVDQLTGTIYSQNTGITDRREVFKVMSRRMLTCSFLSFMTKNTWMCLNLKYSSLSGVKCSQ